MVIEITGNDKVRKAILGMLRPDQEMISAKVARLMFDMIEAQKRINILSSEKLSLEFGELNKRLASASEKIQSLSKKVNGVVLSMKILTMNAMIEASRAGSAETAFEDITLASQETKGMLGNLDQAENKMRTIFLS